MQESCDYKALVNTLCCYKGEEEWLKFKTANCNPERIGQYISALGNSATITGHPFGYLIWGIDDETHSIIGTSFSPQEEKILGWLKGGVSPHIQFDFIELEIDEKRVVVLEIPQAVLEPIAFKGTRYVRVGSTLRELAKYPEYGRVLWANFNNTTPERRIVLSGLSKEELTRYLDLDAYYSVLHLLPSSFDSTITRFLEEGFLLLDDNGTYSITALGALLFGKKLSSFSTLASKACRVIAYSGDSTVSDTIGDIIFDKGYAISFNEVFETLKNILKTKEVFAYSFRRDIYRFPTVAVREILANIIIHQDLTLSGSGPVIEIYSSHLDGRNPGSLLVPKDRIIDVSPKARNEAIASFLRRMNVFKEGGSGFDRIEDALSSAHMPSAIVETVNQITMIRLLNIEGYSNWSKADKIRTCYSFCCLEYVEKNAMTNNSLRERLNIAEKNKALVSRLIKETIEAGLIKLTDETAGARNRSYIPYWASN